VVVAAVGGWLAGAAGRGGEAERPVVGACLRKGVGIGDEAIAGVGVAVATGVEDGEGGTSLLGDPGLLQAVRAAIRAMMTNARAGILILRRCLSH